MKRFAAILAALFSISTAQAGVITIDFESETPGSFAANLEIGSFRFSPNFHYDLVDPTNPNFIHPSQWIGFDGAGPRPNNPNFLGPTSVVNPSLWVDFSETPFSLLGLDLASPTTSHGWFLTSSNGGFIQVSGALNQPHFDFSGPEWSNISWLLFTDPQSAGFPVGFDNISFLAPLPEPGSVLLVGLGLASIVIVRRKRRSQ